jgi:hypothetical protein
MAIGAAPQPRQRIHATVRTSIRCAAARPVSASDQGAVRASCRVATDRRLGD